jgi:putative transposase
VGVVRFATLSDSSYIAPLASFRKHEKRLAKYQRRMVRKVKGSGNWNKAKLRIQRIHARIADARADFLHKASNSISKNHATVVAFRKSAFGNKHVLRRCSIKTTRRLVSSSLRSIA